MSKELQLFLKDELTFKEKFYKFMDILLSEQSNIRPEALIFMGFSYLQTLSLFYAEQINIFNPKNSKSDYILYIIEKIIRVKDLFRNNYIGQNILIYILFIFIIFFILYFLILCQKINHNSIYSINGKIINYLIKIFLFMMYNINLDISFSTFCFGFTENNPNFDQIVKCRSNSNLSIIIISAILIIITFILHIFFQIFYSDLFFFSNTYYAKMSCNYDIYMDINSFINSALTIQAYFLTKESFLIFNVIYSLGMFFYYLKFYLFYDTYISLLTGIFHSLYAWTSIFGLIFAYIDFKEKGILYIISCIIICLCYYNIKKMIEKNILYDKTPNKITNHYHLLFFFKTFCEKIIKFDSSSENKAIISGLLQVLFEEVPNSKSKEQICGDLYLPISNKWRDFKKDKIEDEVFRKYFIIKMMEFFIFNIDNCPDLYFNLSLYYLIIIHNYCQAMYYFQKIAAFKLNYKEYFTYMRLKLKISKILVQDLKRSDEENVSLKSLDISMYYKYDSLSQEFIEEITNDIELSLEFWKIFRRYSKDISFKINFNKVFKLTDKIQTTKKNIEKMWNDLLKIYSGVNEYFEFYNDYIEQINDDDLKKRDLDSLKRKKTDFNEHLTNNYYSILFNKDTGIIIANGDIGSEGMIKHCNKKIENIFNYKISDLKDVNVSKLMPKLFGQHHNKYIEKYFTMGERQYIESKDFKTYGKDKNNSIIQIQLALKLLPIINYNVFFVALIVKENIDDIILIDKNFIIQGMSSKLMKILSIENPYLFQDNDIPFYVICKKFVNFYNIFLKNKSNFSTNELGKKLTTIINEEIILKGPEEKGSIKKNKNNKNEKEEKEEIHENIKINENIELEYEIKIPQFLLDYSEKTKYKNNRNLFAYNKKVEYDNDNNNDSKELFTSDEENEDENDNENELLVQEKDNKNEKSLKKNKIVKIVSTNKVVANNFTPTPTPTPTPIEPKDSFGENLKNRIVNEQDKLNQKSKEERIYIERMNQYQTLFIEEQFNELEDLIDFCNKDSSSTEYKFNFTFDNNRFGKNEISYIVRCIDNKLQEGQSDEKSIGDLDPKAIKYKKEKAEAIKPLFELLDYEREEILQLPEMFIKLSLENKKFQNLLDSCKNEIKNISKTHGQKKAEILEDENSSQTSQTGFDNDLVKKNRIEEIRANLFNSVNNFFTLKYIRITIALIMLSTTVYVIIYLAYILDFNSSLEHVSLVNLYLFRTTLWTTELVSIFISLKALILDKLGKIQIDYLNFESLTIKNITDYYYEMQKIANTLYYNLTFHYGKIEMEVPKYLTEKELLSLYWDHINITYVNDNYMRGGFVNNESFPTAMDQFLCNCINFLKNDVSEEFITSKINNTDFEEYFNYITHLIIENAYNNIIPNQFTKLKSIPNVFSRFNNKKKRIMITIIAIFTGCIIVLCLFYFVMIRTTNKSMTDGFNKITKIKVDKIEERIKKIEIFNYNLKKFRDKESTNMEESKVQTEIIGDQQSKKQLLLPSKSSTSKDNNMINESLEKKMSWDENSSLIGNNGFVTDIKRYIPLTVLTEYHYHAGVVIIFVCGAVILIYFSSITMIQNINQLLIIQKFIYGKLISVSSEIIEVKCFISSCENKTILNYTEFKSNDEIRDMMKGLRNFKKIEDYYNNKYLLNACEAVIDKIFEPEKFEYCMNNDSIISTSNNTDNLLKLEDNIIDNIYKKEDMYRYTYGVQSNRLSLFNESNFQNIEYIFYNYIFSVGDFFADIITTNLDEYLRMKKRILILLVCCLALALILYCLIFMTVYIPKLTHFLSVSRSVMKIIPTSMIMITPELENWIENKYYDSSIC